MNCFARLRYWDRGSFKIKVPRHLSVVLRPSSSSFITLGKVPVMYLWGNPGLTGCWMSCQADEDGKKEGGSKEVARKRVAARSWQGGWQQGGKKEVGSKEIGSEGVARRVAARRWQGGEWLVE
ncbi:hypothetical protein HOLleu_19114 [Holothuria leucospilota]|uniref:Uncharacterized protein n=1 Tax=Holothuria leucospilota TaxID=206669 RepID=A0A9Q1H758_HOLLE|nr:hypothetical protein HOLleu_19114 [Holothuria leucospilota]